jgi:sodium/hydrogen antiporter
MMALIGVVIIVAALISGLIERSNLPQVAVFLALGAALGSHGLGVLNITLDSPALRVVATLSLALVLFTDALTLDLNDARKHARLAFLVLGPGTMLSAALVAVAAWWLLGLPPAAAAIVGAALASTDPVLLRGLLRSPSMPRAARQALRLESGLNDVVLLPIVIVAMALLGSGSTPGGVDWGTLALNLFLLGPGAGVAVGLLAVATLDLVRRRIGVRRDYEALYSLGVAFAAFAAAETVHGSGFLAAFAAGLTIAALDVELCDCFLEYGETTAEMALLFTFVLFGSSLIWSGLGVLTFTSLLFAVLVLLIRPVAFHFALWRIRLDRFERFLISWFGPRGLSTLLLVLLPVFAGVPGSSTMFAICSLVVLLSVIVHGGSIMLLGRSRHRHRQPAPEQALETGQVTLAPPAAPVGVTLAPPLPGASAIELTPMPAPRPAPEVSGNGQATEVPSRAVSDNIRITIEELQALQQAGEPVVVIDARTERAYDSSDLRAPGTIRMVPERVAEQARALGLPKDAWQVIFCA